MTRQSRVLRRHRPPHRRGDRSGSCATQEDRAIELLTTHRRGLDLVAEALLDRETIDGSEVVQLVQQGMPAGSAGNGAGVSATYAPRTAG